MNLSLWQDLAHVVMQQRVKEDGLHLLKASYEHKLFSINGEDALQLLGLNLVETCCEFKVLPC